MDTCSPNSEYCKPTLSCSAGFTLNGDMCYRSSPGGSSPGGPGGSVSQSFASGNDLPKMTVSGNCPIGYIFNQTDNICYPI